MASSNQNSLRAKSQLSPAKDVHELVNAMVSTLTTYDLKKLKGYKITAYKDYIASRVLFNEGILQHACIFANTCIEKELKLVLLLLGVKSKIHDTFNLFNQISRVFTDFSNDINRSFVEVLSEVYKTRYYEDLKEGYSFVINRNKFLAELDYSYNFLENIIQISGVPSLYQQGVNTNDSHLYKNNYLLNNIKKEDFLNTPDLVNEFRIIERETEVTAKYWISHNPDNVFKQPGINGKPGTSIVDGKEIKHYDIELVYKDYEILHQ